MRTNYIIVAVSQLPTEVAQSRIKSTRLLTATERDEWLRKAREESWDRITLVQLDVVEMVTSEDPWKWIDHVVIDLKEGGALVF